MKPKPMFRVLKFHTRGLLFGLVTEELTPVRFHAGHVVTNAIGGGDYRVIVVEDVFQTRDLTPVRCIGSDAESGCGNNIGHSGGTCYRCGGMMLSERSLAVADEVQREWTAKMERDYGPQNAVTIVDKATASA